MAGVDIDDGGSVAARQSSPFTIEMHRDIEAVEQEWDDLADRASAAPFLRPGWFKIWAQAFERRPVAVVTARQNDRLVAALPLVRRALSARSPTNWHSPLFGIVSTDPGATREIVKYLVARRRSVDLSFVEANDPLMSELPAQASALRHRVITRVMQRSPYVEISGGWSEFEGRLPSKFRREIDRRRRRLEAEGTLITTFETGGERLDELLTEGFAVEGSGWKSAQGTAIASRPEDERFYRAVAGWAASHGWLRLGFLRLDGRCVAFSFSVVDQGVVYVMKVGFDPTYRKFAPGTLLTRDALARAFEEQASSYDFLGDEDRYKLDWTDTVRERMRVQAFAPSVAGRAAFAAWRYGRPMARAAAERVASRRRDRG